MNRRKDDNVDLHEFAVSHHLQHEVSKAQAFNSDWQDDLFGYIGGIVRGQKGTLLKIGGVEDHVHLLAKAQSHCGNLRCVA